MTDSPRMTPQTDGQTVPDTQTDEPTFPDGRSERRAGGRVGGGGGGGGGGRVGGGGGQRRGCWRDGDSRQKTAAAQR